MSALPPCCSLALGTSTGTEGWHCREWGAPGLGPVQRGAQTLTEGHAVLTGFLALSRSALEGKGVMLVGVRDGCLTAFLLVF